MGSRREARIAGHHAADQSDCGQDEDCDQQGDGVDHEADVAGLGVFGHGAVEREPADGEAQLRRRG